MLSIRLIAGLTATAALGLTSAADATTFCVGNPGSCPSGVVVKTFQGALDAAAATPGPDAIHVGTG